MLGAPEQLYLVGSDVGYGFVAKLEDMSTKNKNGKAVLSVAQNSRVVAPAPIVNIETDRLAAVTNDGHMLVFAVKDLPMLAKGRGNKIIGVSPKDNETLFALLSIPKGGGITIFAGKQHITLSANELNEYQGERGRRGKKLPRGYQKVDRVVLLQSV